MSDEPVVVIDSDNSVDFDITTDSVDFNLGDVGTLDSDMGNSILVQNTDHAALSNRSLPDQHPISAITGLENALTDLSGDIGTESIRIDLLEMNKQDNLVSGENIKTVGNETLLGSGNVQTIHAAVNGSEALVLWLD